MSLSVSVLVSKSQYTEISLMVVGIKVNIIIIIHDIGCMIVHVAMLLAIEDGIVLTIATI